MHAFDLCLPSLQQDRYCEGSCRNKTPKKVHFNKGFLKGFFFSYLIYARVIFKRIAGSGQKGTQSSLRNASDSLGVRRLSFTHPSSTYPITDSDHQAPRYHSWTINTTHHVTTARGEGGGEERAMGRAGRAG